MLQNAFPVFVGFDSREAAAARVCRHSLLRHSSSPLFVQNLHEPSLRHIGMFTRQWLIKEGAQKIDRADQKPFSTAFSFSRFLVPALMQHTGWALFTDGDFLFLGDIAELVAMADPRFAALVVKRDHRPAAGSKMDGVAQQPYFRKNWSSFVLWNCGHPANQRLTTSVVNTAPGQWLHAFSWLDDDQIGDLPPDWNWLSGIDEIRPGIKAMHFTLGSPDMPGHEDSPGAEQWRAELAMVRATIPVL